MGDVGNGKGNKFFSKNQKREIRGLEMESV